MRGVIVNEFDICGESCSRVSALDEIMTKQGVARKTSVENGIEDRDFIDTFAGETALAEQVLIGIGNSARVDVESALARVDGRQA